jgi:hypothetical protein
VRALTTNDILTVFEQGHRRHVLDRALLPLAAALPARPWTELTALPIGTRDGLLLLLRRITLGPRLDIVVACPRCRELMDFAATADELLVHDPLQPMERVGRCACDGGEIEFRLLDSNDLAAVLHGADRATSRATLAQRSILALHGITAADPLPPSLIDRVASALALADPQADILFGLECPSCRHGFRAMFDIASFFWREITAIARRLLDDVHALARFYGWREADILAMTPVRRQYYLDRVAP